MIGALCTNNLCFVFSKYLQELFTKDPPPIESCLTDEKQGMKRAILEVIAAGIVRTPEHISQYITCTLMAAIDPSKDGPAPITTTNAINWLGRNKFITWMKQPGTLDFHHLYPVLI